MTALDANPPTLTLVAYRDVSPHECDALTEAAGRRGVPVRVVEPHELRVSVGTATVVAGGDGAPIPAGPVLHRTVVRHLDLVEPALEALGRSGDHTVVNEIGAALTARNKLRAHLRLAAAGVRSPETVGVAHAPAHVPWTAADTVTKPVHGARGDGVAAVATAALSDTWPAGETARLAQPRVAGRYDLRAYVVDGTAVAAAVRAAAAGEWRCNAARGAAVTVLGAGTLRSRAESAAVAAVRALDLDAASVDLLCDGDDVLVSEVDPWGGFRHTEAACGTDIGDRVVAAALRRHAAGGRRP